MKKNLFITLRNLPFFVVTGNNFHVRTFFLLVDLRYGDFKPIVHDWIRSFSCRPCTSETTVSLACAAGGIVRVQFWRRSRDPKKGVGTRHLKYRLPENPGILNSPHTSVRGN